MRAAKQYDPDDDLDEEVEDGEMDDFDEDTEEDDEIEADEDVPGLAEPLYFSDDDDEDDDL